MALLLRGTRNLKHWYQCAQQYFTNVLHVGSPNGVIDDLFLADLGPHAVAYASVYGAPMASEIVHVCGVLGTRLVVQIGNCGALADDLAAGDLCNFGMDRTSLLYVVDNPRQKAHRLLGDADKAERRRAANDIMIDLALDVIRTYASRR